MGNTNIKWMLALYGLSLKIARWLTWPGRRLSRRHLARGLPVKVAGNFPRPAQGSLL